MNSKEQQKLLDQYCPRLWLHSGEEAMPVSIEHFLQYSNYITADNKNLGQVDSKFLYNKYLEAKGADTTDYLSCLETKGADVKTLDTQVPVYGHVANHAKDGFLDLVYGVLFLYSAPYPVVGGGHQGDVEHITVRVDSTSHKLQSIYFSAHGYADGTRVSAASNTLEFSEGHPLAYVAKGSHAMYPHAGRIWRYYGAANDVTDQGHLWKPKMQLILDDTDPSFDAATSGWAYFTGRLGFDGVASMARQRWFNDENNDPSGRSAFSRAFLCY